MLQTPVSFEGLFVDLRVVFFARYSAILFLGLKRWARHWVCVFRKTAPPRVLNKYELCDLEEHTELLTGFLSAPCRGTLGGRFCGSASMRERG